MSGWFNYGPEGNRRQSVFGFWRVGAWLRSGGLRSVELNAVGWVALISPGVVLGLLVARLTDSSFWVFGLVGGVTIWAIAALVDNFRFGRVPARLTTERLNDAELEHLVEAARHAGIRFEHELGDDDTISVLSTQQRFVDRLSHLLWVIRRPGGTDA